VGRTGSLAGDPDPDLGDLVAVKEVEVDNSNNKRRQVEDRAEEVLGVNNSSMVGTISSHSWPRDPPNLKEQEVEEGEARDTTVEGSQGGKGHDGVSGGGVADGGGGSAEGRDTDGGGGGGRLSVASGVSRKETATAATANTESRLSDRDRDRDRGQDRVDAIDGKVVSGEQAQELLRL